MDLDKNNQPDVRLHYLNNVAKHLNELIGICRGIAANHVVNQAELSYLHAWLRDNNELRKDPDYVDLLDVTTDLAERADVDPCDFGELLDLIECVLEFNCEANKAFESVDVAIGRLIGLSRGLLSDGVLDDTEIRYLNKWLQKCDAFKFSWPINEVSGEVDNILADGVISDIERKRLYNLLEGLIGGSYVDTGITGGFSSSFYCNDNLDLEFDGKEYCLTGHFLYGTRSKCKETLVKLGAVVAANPRKTTDYLVVGALSSRDWRQSSFGRKIEKAISLRDSGQNIVLLHEDVWSNQLR